MNAMTKAPEAAQSALDVLLMDATDQHWLALRSPGRGRHRRGWAGATTPPRRAPRREPGRRAGRVASGRSDVLPAKRARRFADQAWQSSSLFRRLVQTYLAAGETVDGLIPDADVDSRAQRQARSVAGDLWVLGSAVDLGSVDLFVDHL
jgi:polyhydroxyalkanoate synthase